MYGIKQIVGIDTETITHKGPKFNFNCVVHSQQDSKEQTSMESNKGSENTTVPF